MDSNKLELNRYLNKLDLNQVSNLELQLFSHGLSFEMSTKDSFQGLELGQKSLAEQCVRVVHFLGTPRT